MARQLNSRDLEAFDAVMSLGTATAAANALSTSQPAISRSLAELERRLQMRLFIRGNRLQPTPEADALHDEVRRSLVGLSRIEEAARAIAGQRTGHVSVVAPPALAYGFLAAAVARFSADRPSVLVEIEVQSSATVARWVAAQRFDIGLATYGGPAVPNVEQQRFAALPEVMVMSASAPLAARERVTPADLHDIDMVALSQGDPYRHRLDKLLVEAGAVPRIRAEAPHSAALCELVARGIGVALVNPFTARDFAARLTSRPFAPELPYEVALLTPSLRPAGRLARSLIDALTAELCAFSAH